jgi:hypothetical protein
MWSNMNGQEMLQCWTLVELLTKDEANSVTILSPNYDFGGAAVAIEANGDWTDWKDKRYEGDTILQCLDAANRDRCHFRR